MIQVEIEITIQCPSDEVFAYISNFENNPQWQSGMKEARFTSEMPLAVGSEYEQVAMFLGKKIVSRFQVMAFDPGRMVKASSTAGSFPITFTRWVEAVSEGTKVSARIEGDANGFFKLAEPLMKRMVQRSIEKDYVNLKRVLESQNR